MLKNFDYTVNKWLVLTLYNNEKVIRAIFMGEMIASSTWLYNLRLSWFDKTSIPSGLKTRTKFWKHDSKIHWTCYGNVVQSKFIFTFSMCIHITANKSKIATLFELWLLEMNCGIQKRFKNILNFIITLVLQKSVYDKRQKKYVVTRNYWKRSLMRVLR